MIIYLNYHNTLYPFDVINRGYDINRGHCFRRVVINIRASKNISGLVKVSVTSSAGLMNFFLNVEPCIFWEMKCLEAHGILLGNTILKTIHL